MKSSTRFSVIGVVVAAVVAAFFLRGAVRPAANPAESPLAASAPAASAKASGAAPLPAPAPLPRLVDLGRGTCIPCKMMAPILEELAETYAGKLVVEVIDLREQPEAAGQYGIRVIPTQIFYDASGTERFRHEGFLSKDAILTKWRELGVELVAAPAAGVGASSKPGAGETH